MTDSLTQAADQALEAALAASGARDPREFYRERLREIKRVRPQEYEGAVDYYQKTLIPEVARGTRDALEAWTDYGRRLAVALAPGRTVAIDESGRAYPWNAKEPGRLVLHLPDEKGARALLVGLPPVLSDAQRATYDVLVAGKQRFGAGGVPE
jgi:hypothetical protein